MGTKALESVILGKSHFGTHGNCEEQKFYESLSKFVSDRFSDGKDEDRRMGKRTYSVFLYKRKGSQVGCGKRDDGFRLGNNEVFRCLEAQS